MAHVIGRHPVIDEGERRSGRVSLRDVRWSTDVWPTDVLGKSRENALVLGCQLSPIDTCFSPRQFC